MGRHSCCYKQKLRKGLWSPEEDEKLVRYITKYGHGCWSSVPKLAGLQRCGKSCRLRWINYLRPDLKRGTFSQQEEDLIIELHTRLGNRWSQIAAQLPGRTDNEIKNLWNSSIKKKLIQLGIDPKTHKLLSEERSKDPWEAEISESDNSPGDKKISGALSSTNNLRVDTPYPRPLLQRTTSLPSGESYSLNASFSSKTRPSSENPINSTTTKEFFAPPQPQQRHASATGIFPFQELNYGSNAMFPFDPTLGSAPSYFSHNLNMPLDILKSDFSSTSSTTPTVILPQSRSLSSFLPSPPLGLLSNGKVKSSELLQGNINMLPWDHLAERDGQMQSQPNHVSCGNEGEEVKWADYLNIPFLINNNNNPNPAQNQEKQAPQSACPSETRFISSDSSSCSEVNHHRHPQQELPSQASDIYCKDIRRLAAALGNY